MSDHDATTNPRANAEAFVRKVLNDVFGQNADDATVERVASRIVNEMQTPPPPAPDADGAGPIDWDVREVRTGLRHRSSCSAWLMEGPCDCGCVDARAAFDRILARLAAAEAARDAAVDAHDIALLKVILAAVKYRGFVSQVDKARFEDLVDRLEALAAPPAGATDTPR